MSGKTGLVFVWAVGVISRQSFRICVVIHQHLRKIRKVLTQPGPASYFPNLPSPPSPHTAGVLSREALPSCCGHSASAPLSGGQARPLSRLFSNESRPTPFRALRRACTGHPMPPRHEIAKLPRQRVSLSSPAWNPPALRPGERRSPTPAHWPGGDWRGRYRLPRTRLSRRLGTHNPTNRARLSGGRYRPSGNPGKKEGPLTGIRTQITGFQVKSLIH